MCFCMRESFKMSGATKATREGEDGGMCVGDKGSEGPCGPESHKQMWLRREGGRKEGREGEQEGGRERAMEGLREGERKEEKAERARERESE